MKKTVLLMLGTFMLMHVFSQREMERLNRGLVAFNRWGVSYINWRLYALEDYSVGFNIYRSVNGSVFEKLNSDEITATTDYLDQTADLNQNNTYYVVPVVNGVEQEESEMYTLKADTEARQYFPINLEPIRGKLFTDYNILHVYPGDFDGDGDYDYLVKRFPVDARYNTILLDCYDNEGSFKWRIDLGPNVETYISSMTAPVLVADFDSDGKSEIILKTGEGTVFGNGSVIPDTDGDGITDYNSHDGSGTYANVMAGPEFISYVDGETGAELDRDNFLSRRDPYKDWGDKYGARMNFMMSSVGYFDGVHPACVFSRGDGGEMDIDAWQIIDGKLKQLWYYTARGKTYNVGGWTDFHQVQCIDVDGDGKDEISWGACMLDDDGTVLYTTKYCHGDRFQITDINPNRPGLEVFIVQQNNGEKIGSALYDAATGKTIKDWYINAIGDIGRGDAADVDPNSPGLELFDTGQPGLHASDGSEVFPTNRPYPWVSIWWDGDLLRENMIGVGKTGESPAINKWDYTANAENRLFTIYNDGGSYIVRCPYAARIPLVGDVLGDWREEIFLETADRATLRIYSSNTPAEARLYALMQNPAYRTAITSKGYLCTKYTDYFLGAGMQTPPKPDIVLVGEEDCAGEMGGTAVADNCGRCVGGETGYFACADIEEGYYHISNILSQLYFSASDELTQQILVNEAADQIWKIEKSGQNYKIYSPSQQAYLSYGTPEDAGLLGFGTEGNDEFFFENYGDGSILISAATDDNFLIDVPSCSKDAGVALKFWSRLGNLCQRFAFESVESRFDCAGVWDGDAVFDDCGLCSGGTSGNNACRTIQMEDVCGYAGTEETSHAGYNGRCYLNVDNALGASVSAVLMAENDATEEIAIKYSNASVTASLRPMQVLLNGQEVIDSLEFPLTDNWDEWSTVSITVELHKGANKLELVSLTEEGAANLDQFEISSNISSLDCATQTMHLASGWNLISFYVQPFLPEIESVFEGVDFELIKTTDGFYVNNYPDGINSLEKVQTGTGYLVYVSAVGEQTFSIDGALITNAGTDIDSLPAGWSLIGASADALPVTEIGSECSLIKDFDEFYSEGTGTLETIKPGKAYFVYKK